MPVYLSIYHVGTILLASLPGEFKERTAFAREMGGSDGGWGCGVE